MKHLLHLPSLEDLARWIQLFPDDRQDLRDALYFLILGEEVHSTLRLPRPEALLEHVRIVRDQDPELFELLADYLPESEPGRGVLRELAVDALLAAPGDSWEHPSQVLDRPRPDFGKLVPICEDRRSALDGKDREHAEETLRKLTKAADIAESARRRRYIMKRGRKRRRPAPDRGKSGSERSE